MVFMVIEDYLFDMDVLQSLRKLKFSYNRFIKERRNVLCLINY